MGIVRVSTALSLDGYMAGPNHEMDWVFDHAGDASPELIQELIDTTGAILSGRGSYDVGRGSTRQETSGPFGGRWSGPQFVLMHDPPDDEQDESITFLSGDIRDAVATAREAAGERNVLILGAMSPTRRSTPGPVYYYVLRRAAGVILCWDSPAVPAREGGSAAGSTASIASSAIGEVSTSRYGVST